MSVILNGTEYNDSDFAEFGYVDIFPEQVMSDFLAETGIRINSIASLQTTSASSIGIGTGTKVFVLADDKTYQAGMYVIAADAAAPTTNFMTGQATGYVSGTKTLTFTVETAAGSGTQSDWRISGIGERGPSGSGTPAISGGDANKLIRINGAETNYEKVSPLTARGRYTVKTANYTAVDGDFLALDSSGGGFTITLPASPSAGDEVRLLDQAGVMSTNNVTIARNGQTIMGLSEDMDIVTNNAPFGLVFIGSDWRFG